MSPAVAYGTSALKRERFTAAQLELTGAELGPRVRLYAPPPPKPETVP